MDTAQRSNKSFVLAAAVLGVLAFFAIGARAVVADAYGGPLDAAAALPADMQGVVVVDLAEIRDFADSDLVAYSIELGQETGELPPGDPEGSLIDFIDSELGIDIDKDVLSWIGRSAAVGVAGDLSQLEPESVIAAITVRNVEEAWRFVDLVVERTLAEVPSAVSSETTIDGLRVVLLDSGENPAHFGVKGEHLVIADSRQSIQSAYDTIDSGTSVLDAEWFRAADSELDRNAWMKIMVDPAFLNDSLAEMTELLDQSGDTGSRLGDNALTSIGLSYGLEGDEVTMEAYLGFTEEFGTEMSSPLPLTMLADLAHTPDVLFGVELPDDFGELMLAGIEESSPGAVAEMEETSLQFLGIDFVSAGLAELSGHFMVSASGDGLDAFDVLVSAGLADSQPLTAAFEELRVQMASDGIELGGRDGLLRFRDENIDIGVLGDEFVFQADSDPGTATPFVDSEGYEWLASNFPRGAIFYMDLQSLMGADELGLDPEMFDDLDALRLGATFDAGADNVRFTGILQISLSGR
ncbi:MAG: DUF3352 domain-containing protein [bacterium]|nr:DUF3352 domain-containing protein [bacterium]